VQPFGGQTTFLDFIQPPHHGAHLSRRGFVGSDILHQKQIKIIRVDAGKSLLQFF
jgi:hypothetical protein